MQEDGPYRCTHCGNRTRFDVYETVQRRRYAHFTLAGEPTGETGEEIIDRRVERVVCPYCSRADGVSGAPTPAD